MVNSNLRNETINLAYGEGHTLLELVKYIEENLNKKAKLTIADSQIGEVTYYVADIAKARNLLGYDPKTPLREGIKKHIEWYKSL